MERWPTYLAAFGWIAAGVAGSVLAAFIAGRLGIQPLEFASSAAAAAVLALVFARRPAEGIGAFLLFILFAGNWAYWLGLDLRLADESTVALFGAVGLLRRYFAAERLRLGVKEAALAVVLVTGLASSLLNNVPLGVWGPAVILLFKAIAFFYLVSWLSLSVGDVQRVGLVIGSVVLVIAGLGFVEFLDPTRFQQFFGLPQFVGERGELSVTKSVFLHPALFGWLTAAASLFLYARFMVMRSWWGLPLALVLNVGTILSTRRTPLIGLAVALVAAMVWHLSSLRSVRIGMKVWVPVIAAVLLLIVVFRPALTYIYEYTIDEYLAPRTQIDEILASDPDPDVIAAVQPRVALYIGSIAIARDHFPLGAGLGRFGSHMSREEYSPVYAQYGLDGIPELAPTSPDAVTDTFWPMVLGETGVIGLVGFATFAAVLLAELWRAANSASSLASRTFALGALLLFVESFVGSLTAATYAAPPIAYFVFAASGASLALRPNNHSPTAR